LAWFCAIVAALAAAVVIAPVPQVGAQTPESPEARELVIGTKVAPPLAIKAEDGTWHGISIDLWRRIADRTHLRYRFEETTLQGLTEGVADGSLDAGVAALSVTEPRRETVDFTQPFYSTGLGIAVARDVSISWWPIVANVLSVFFVLSVCCSPSRLPSVLCSGSSSGSTMSISAPIGEAWAQVFGGRQWQ
jgi:polar amino acid transport system substrate-binding protein